MWIWLVSLLLVPLPTSLLSTFCFCFFLFLWLKKLSPNGSLLCLWLSEKTECLNSATRPLICDWLREMRQPSVATRRGLSARFSLLQRPTAGLRPQHEKHTRHWPPGEVTVYTDVERNSPDATTQFLNILEPLFRTSALKHTEKNT